MAGAVKLIEKWVGQGALEVDREARVVRGIRFINEKSTNGYRYTPEALRRAVKLYDGLALVAEHKRNGRTVFEKFAVTRNARFDETGKGAGVTGDAEVFGGADGDRFIDIAEKAPHFAGLSHEATGRFGEAEKQVVEIESVDVLALVGDPATTKTLAESEGARGRSGRTQEEESVMNLDELKVKHPGLVKELREEFTHEAKDSGERKKLVEERDELKKKVATLEAEKKATELKTKIAVLLKESKLPEPAKTPELREHLEGAKDEDDAKKRLLAVEAAVAQATGQPVSEEKKTSGEKLSRKETVEKVTA